VLKAAESGSKTVVKNIKIASGERRALFNLKIVSCIKLAVRKKFSTITINAISDG